MMTKSDLKNGMVVECRNEERYIVLDDRFISLNGFNELRDYEENLECIDYSQFDIIKVYKIRYASGLNSIFEDERLQLIWERPDPILELTLEDIAKKFNVNVNQIKIKK